MLPALPLSTRWIVATVVGGIVAAGLHPVLAEVVSRAFGEPESAAAGMVLRLLHVLPGAAEGAIFGAAQAWALGRSIPVPPKRFVLATIGAHAVFWFAQALVSYEPSEPPTMGVLLLFAAVVGAVLGGLLGFAQRWALRPHVAELRGFVPTSVAAWAVGMVVTAVAADLVPWGPFDLVVLAIEMVGGAATGLVVGLTMSPVVARLSPRL